MGAVGGVHGLCHAGVDLDGSSSGGQDKNHTQYRMGVC